MDTDNNESKETNQEDPKESNCQNYFYIIPAILVEDTPNKTIGIIYGLLVSLCNKTGYCWANNTYLANKLKLSTRSIQRHLSYLTFNGWINIEINQKEGNTRKIKVCRSSLEVMTPAARPYVKEVVTPNDANVIYSNKEESSTTSNKEERVSVLSKASQIEKTLASKDAHELTNLMIELIRKKDPNFPTPNKVQWNKDFDLLLRADQRPRNEAEDLLRLARDDIFWKKNILSPKKFRDQYTRLKIEFEETKPKPEEDIKYTEGGFS